MSLDFNKTNYQLKNCLAKMQAYDIALIINDLERKEVHRVFSLLAHKNMAKVFSRLTKYQQLEIFSVLDVFKQKTILNNLEIDELKEFVSYYEEDEQIDVLKLLNKSKYNIIKDILIYSNDTAPSIMSTEFIVINKTLTIKEATSKIFKEVKDNDFIDHIYIVNDDELLLGVLPLKDLIVARSSDTISKLMINDFIYAYNDNSIKETIEIVRNYDIPAVPVIDHSGYLLGIITADDVLEQLINQYDEAYQRLAYIKDHDESYSGAKRSMIRLPWLVIATIFNLIIAAILASIPSFEATVSQIITLVLFQPLILDMAGNIGTQNLAVTILEISRDELDSKKKISKFFKKELTVSILNSLFVAVIGFFMAMFFTYFNNHQTIGGINVNSYKMGIVVGSSLFISMALSGLLGTYIPLMLSKANLDTDNASGPILTTLNDIIALFTYYGIATILLMV